MQNKILVVEDSKSLREIVTALLRESGYMVFEAGNGKEALEIMKNETVSIVLTDIEMPVMAGDELIDNINTMSEKPVVIVFTSHDSSDLIVKIMKKGVFEYLIKPVKKNDLLLKIKNAEAISELNRVKSISEKEKVIRLENQLSWYRFQEKFENKHTVLNDGMLFENLQRSLNQGAGFGTLVSLIEVFTATARKKGNVYEIDDYIIDGIKNNQAIIYKAMDVFSDIENVTVNEIELEHFLLSELYGFIKHIIDNETEIISINNHNVLLSDYKPPFDKLSIMINKPFFEKVIRELLINSCKYSRKGSTVYVIIEHTPDELEISFINNTKQGEEDGIPVEYENIIFEPFFRKVKYIQENYKSLDYGLGLTLVEKIIERHGGKVSIYNIKDYSSLNENPAIKVNCKISLPLSDS
ncbi:MAG: response regulator [Spirochaetes bacterium]|nr:response regulator [Spirochaetota bacterium]